MYDRYTYSVGSYLWDYLLISPLITELIYPPPIYVYYLWGWPSLQLITYPQIDPSMADRGQDLNLLHLSNYERVQASMRVLSGIIERV